ncbi:unnamed protein product [Rangifer tarandus platyrhynchus]|uniref:Uncharacterized protein n=1 Tax=Rangifer tarandus platyrhynchus TaxID=3082113 RepID=A0AC59Y589_RANTA
MGEFGRGSQSTCGHHVSSPTRDQTGTPCIRSTDHQGSPPISCLRICLPGMPVEKRGVMGFWKFPPFLVLGILVLYQAGMYHAAPLRSVFDGRFDPATLDEEESRLLLSAMVNDYEQMRARESEKAQKTEGSRIQKRACNTATCMTHRLAGWLSRSGSMVRSNLLPTKMGFKIFSGPRRNYWF